MKIFIYIFILLSLFCNAQKSVFIGKTQIDPVALHIDGSILMTATFSQFHYNCTDKKNMGKSILIGATSSLFIGVVCKELIHDKWLERGVYSNWDIADDIWGTLCGIVFIRCKFDFDENGLIKWGQHKPHRNKFDKQKYSLN